jgi:hypothetical protein
VWGGSTGSLHPLPFPSQYGTVPKQKQSYTVDELRDLASGLRRLLGSIEDGSLAADAGTISRLEGAAAANLPCQVHTGRRMAHMANGV